MPAPPEGPQELDAFLARVLRAGAREWNAHRFFECHEVLEDAWQATKHEKKREPAKDPRRDFFHGIILLAAAYVHWQRGNPIGIERKLHQAKGLIDAYPDRMLGVAFGPWRRAVEADLRRGIQGAAFDPAHVPPLRPEEVAD